MSLESYVNDAIQRATLRVEGKKLDAGKDRWDLLPYDAIEEVVKVMTFGANKYSDRNWENGISHMRLFSACMRHMTAWLRGQDKDPETGLSHLAHAACCILFVLAFKLRDNRGEDRPGGEPMPPGMDRRGPPAAEDSVEEVWSMREDARPSAAFLEAARVASRTDGFFDDGHEPEGSIEDMPHEFRPRFTVIPGIKTATNCDGGIYANVNVGDDILIYLKGKFQWAYVREISDTMDGVKYNVPEIPGATSILMVPKTHVFAVRSKHYVHFGDRLSNAKIKERT